MTTATVGGTLSNGDTVNVTVYDAGIGGGSQTFTHTVVAPGDTINSIASDLATKISALSGNGITGSVPNSTTGVINISSISQNTTTYTVSVTGAQTETITLAPTVGATQAAYNNVNEPTSISAGGAVRFSGTTDRPVQPVTMNSGAVTAIMLSSQSFYANPILASGVNAETVSATSGGGTNTTNTYQILASSTASASLTSDANGNLTSDGTRSFAWDAENRLVQVTYPGSGNYSTFLYDGLSRVVQIVEYTGGTATSTKNFIWCGNRMCEARDASSNLISQYFALGQVNFSGGIGSNFLYTKDHLGSIREMTNGTGTVVYQQSFDPYGRPIVLVNATAPDFGYAGMYYHQPSGLYLTKYRAYSASLGRWISREPDEDFDDLVYGSQPDLDPISYSGNPNLYQFDYNNPVMYVDPDGLLPFFPPPPGGRGNPPPGGNGGKPNPEDYDPNKGKPQPKSCPVRGKPRMRDNYPGSSEPALKTAVDAINQSRVNQGQLPLNSSEISNLRTIQNTPGPPTLKKLCPIGLRSQILTITLAINREASSCGI